MTIIIILRRIRSQSWEFDADRTVATKYFQVHEHQLKIKYKHMNTIILVMIYLP